MVSHNINISDPRQYFLKEGPLAILPINKKPKLIKVAGKVKRQAEIYGGQLKGCREKLDKATKSWFFW